MSSGWQTAFAVFALLSMNNCTKNEKLIESAKMAIDYIKSLQILDSRCRRKFGAFREVTPQTQNGCILVMPFLRHGLCWVGIFTMKIVNALERAVFFADWMLKYAFRDNWPIATISLCLGGRNTDHMLGSFQSGGILFSLEMYDATGDIRYRNAAEKMTHFYLQHFIDSNGKIMTLKDVYGDCPSVNDKGKWPLDWQRMHQVNDDFGGISLARASTEFGITKSRKILSKYFNWLENNVSEEGSFFDPPIEVGSATTAIFLNSYLKIAPENKKTRIMKMRDLCLNYLLKIQVHSKNKQIDGAFLGMDNHCKCGMGKWINIRSTSYSVIALLGKLGKASFPVSYGNTNI